MAPARFHFNFLKDLLGEKEEYSFRPKTHGNTTEIFKKHKKPRLHKGGSFYGFSRGGYKVSSNSKSSKQSCTLICSHRYDKFLNKKHFDYIQKEGKGLNGADPELYGADPENYEKRMSKLHFRWIISPENQNVDLNLLVNEFIRRIEWSTGHKLNWVAANHYNTDQQHAHVLINGFDLNRQKVKFDRDFLKNVYRETLKELCTDQVGPRTPEEINAAYQRQTVSNMFTSLDRRLETILGRYDFIDSRRLNSADNNTLLHKRLLHLKSLDLVDYDHAAENFIFKPVWKEQLKIYGKYNTYLDGLRFLGVHPSRYSLHEIDKYGFISGKVVKRYYMQENSNNHAVILETKPGYFSYVPLFEAPVNATPGSNIKIEFERVSTSTGGTRKIMNITNLT